MPDLSLVLFETGKLLLQGYFNMMRQAGKSPEEIDALYESEKRRGVEENTPDQLADPEA